MFNRVFLNSSTS